MTPFAPGYPTLMSRARSGSADLADTLTLFPGRAPTVHLEVDVSWAGIEDPFERGRVFRHRPPSPLKIAVLRDELLELLDLAAEPVRLDPLALALAADERELLAEVERLVAAGVVIESRDGLTVATPPPRSGPTRRAHLASRLADALDARGGRPTTMARLHLEAGKADAALAAALRADDTLAACEIALAAVEAGASVDRAVEGTLRLRRARHRRASGDSDGAAADLEVAVRRLSGPEQVDALGFAGAVADDRQRPQEAEAIVAMGELAASLLAAGAEGPAKLGSLLTFHARLMGRLGFAEEADQTLGRGQAILASHGTPPQRFRARNNQAWLHFDRGEVAAAEVLFGGLAAEAEDLEGPASRADKEAWWARSLFAAGRPVQALEVAASAQHLAEATDSFAVFFLLALARAEAGILYQRYEEADRAADEVLAICEERLPAWRNVGRYLKSRALLGLGRNSDAATELSTALELTPPGIDGLRWRQRVRALEVKAGQETSQREEENLTDELLAARWWGAAIELMTFRANRRRDPSLAADAAALALQVGNPMAAATALQAADAWKDPVAPSVGSAIRTLAERIPLEWKDEWSALPEVKAGLAEPVVDEQAAVETLRGRVEQMMTEAGLIGEGVLSPAQRRATGLVRRRPIRRSPLALVAAGIGVVAVAVVASLAVNALTAPPPTAVPTTQTTTTTLPPLEDRVVALPESRITGTAGFRGDSSRSGLMSGGLQTVTGHYWRQTPGGDPIGSPVAYGALLYVPTTAGSVFILDQTSGAVQDRIGDGLSISTSPAVAEASSGESSGTPFLFVGTTEGGVVAYNALRPGPTLWPPFLTGGAIKAEPLVAEGLVVVASTDGFVYGIKGAGGELVWRYPAEGAEPLSEILGAPAYSEGTVLVVESEGVFHSLSAATGELLCQRPISLTGRVVTNPVVSGTAVYVGIEAGGFHSMEACGGAPPGRQPFYPSSESVTLAPAVDGDTMFLIENRLLLAMDLRAEAWQDDDAANNYVWEEPYDAGALISTSPNVADGVVYVGGQDGYVHAVKAADGSSLWKFNIGSAVAAAPLPVKGAVLAVGADGRVWAIAGE